MTINFDGDLAQIVGIEGAVIYNILEEFKITKGHPFVITVEELKKRTRFFTRQELYRGIRALVDEEFVDIRGTKVGTVNCYYCHLWDRGWDNDS